MFKKILIANRGEIAVRISRACREMGIISAAIYSEADKTSLHARTADEAHLIGPAPAAESYLNIKKIIALAKEIGADAIHPGYGFLSENPIFISEVEKSGLTFIGPSSKSVLLMGSKTDARSLMKKHNVPIVPGTEEPINNVEEAKKIAEEIGYPIMLKASAGGGGKGMRKVNTPDEFIDSFERAQNEALKAFGNDSVYMEKFIENPKHIEVQILADKKGNYIHLLERECSIQRRHQKIIEECPSPSVDEELRERITKTAIEAAKACQYFNAGTVEFLMDKDRNFYFLEMNTRLQVEHPVTEMVSGVDLVKQQILVASGEELTIKQSDIKINGHAIECRVYAEDTDNNFAPSTGTIIHHSLPYGPGIRVDGGIDVNSEVSVYYDPMLSKVITWHNSREEAIRRMHSALASYEIAGVKTNINILIWILNHPEFVNGSFNINFVDEYLMKLIPNEWKEKLNSEYLNVAGVLAVLLKEKNRQLKPDKISTPLNTWESLRYE